MQVIQMFVYPVKSMQGFATQSRQLGARGLLGDRSHALQDTTTGIVLTGRRDPALLFARGLLGGDGSVTVELPDGTVTASDDQLSTWIGRPVRLATPTAEPSTYEISVDFEDDDSEVATWTGPSETFHDSTRTQISIVCTGDLRSWDVRRFRPNVVVEADTIEHLVGTRIRIGSAEIDIVKPIDRCVMVTRPQPGDIHRDLDVLRTINAERSSCFGIGGLVRATATIEVGDQVEVLSAASAVRPT